MRDIVQVPAKPAPTPVAGLALPARGRLLVSDADGLFVVARNGKRTRLGRYDDATWSPDGPLRRRDAPAARSPRSTPTTRSVRWTLRPGGAVSLPRWAPDGLHIAYRAGGALRIVYGNGEHDVLAGPRHGARRPRLAPGTQPRTSPGRRPTAP